MINMKVYDYNDNLLDCDLFDCLEDLQEYLEAQQPTNVKIVLDL